MFKILQARLQQYVSWELWDVQVGLRKGKGTRDQIANIRWIVEKAMEFQKNIYFCFTGGFHRGSAIKNLPAMQETWVQSLSQKIPWRRAWQPTLVFLPRESHGQRSLAGCSPKGRTVRHDWCDLAAAAAASLTMLKPLTAWITTNCGKFLKRWEHQTTLLSSWEICIRVKKQQLEPDMEKWTGSKLERSITRLHIITLLI